MDRKDTDTELNSQTLKAWQQPRLVELNNSARDIENLGGLGSDVSLSSS